MLPLYLANENEDLIIRKISGTPQLRQHINTLGMTEGSTIRIVSNNSGNLIIQVRESRLAIGSDLAKKIYI